MPLKHSTETLLVLVLAIAIAITGLVIAVLPPLSVSIFPWAVAFAVSVIYPIVLTPLFRDRRADYTFRALHAVPAIMLLVWLLLELSGGWAPLLETLRNAFTWGGALVAVGISFLLLLIFCLKVLRQRGPRSALLAAVFLPFLLLGLLNERYDWKKQVVSFFETESGSVIVADNRSSSSSRSNSSVRIGQSSSVPPHLPSAGFGTEILIPMMLAGYCATVQKKSAKRARMRG